MFVGSTGQNTGGLRIGGLATGLDTESLVRDMMRVHRIRVDRLKQDRQLVEWRRDAYREVTTQLRRFADDFLSPLNPASDMRSASNLMALNAVSSDPSFVSVSAGSSAVTGTVTIAGIDRLATPTSILGRTGLLQPGMTIDSSLEALGFAATGTRVEFTIAGRNFAFNSTDSMRHVMNTVNADTAAGVRFFYSGIESRFIIQTRNTGAATSSLAVSGAFLETLGLAGVAATRVNGQDASVRFQTTGGLSTVTVNQAANTFTLDGITYNLIRATPAGVSLTVTVSQNVDRAVDTIKAFVERYNQVLGNINERLVEQRFRDYRPLTQEQRKEMSEHEIKQWESRAKSGLLNNNRTLQSTVDALRSAFTQPFQAAGISLQEIGITTGSHFERGRLHINETRLREALSARGEQITSLFTNQSAIAYSPDLTSAQRAQRTAESGIAHRVSDVLQDMVRLTRNSHGRKGTLLERAGFIGSITEFQNELNTQIRGIDSRIESALEAMKRSEQRYWRQFTALEDAIQRMNAQSAWLSQQLAAGSQ
jgi:flagellar hook-associated protein 2